MLSKSYHCLIFGLGILTSCTDADPFGSDQFPVAGDYGVTVTELGQTRERGDIYVDASSAEKMNEFVVRTLFLKSCSGDLPVIGGGKIAGRMKCPILARSYETDILGSYDAQSIDLVSSADTGELGPYVMKRHYRLLKPSKP